MTQYNSLCTQNLTSRYRGVFFNKPGVDALWLRGCLHVYVTACIIEKFTNGGGGGGGSEDG